MSGVYVPQSVHALFLLELAEVRLLVQNLATVKIPDSHSVIIGNTDYSGGINMDAVDIVLMSS